MSVNGTSYVNGNIYVVKGNDQLTVVNCPDNKSVKAQTISDIAAKQIPGFPNYAVDGAGAILAFHTEKGVFVLGGVRSNNDLKDLKTSDGTSYPDQIQTSTGGKVLNPQLSVREAITNAIAYKLFYDSKSTISPLTAFFKTLAEDAGWDERICVHTDSWKENNETKTMCYLTTVKHIYCAETDVQSLNTIIKSIMEDALAKGAQPRTITEFQIQPLTPIINNSIDLYLKDVKERAEQAYEKYGNTITVPFDPLSTATLAQARHI